MSLRKAWGIPEWQRRIGKSRRTQVEVYAQEFRSIKGDPHRRIIKLAGRHEVTPECMRRALRRYWGVAKFNKLVPPIISRPEKYARAFEQSRGVPEARIRSIAKEHGVQTIRVKSALRRYWGLEHYQKKLGIPRHNPEALLALMNDPKVQKSNDALGMAAKRLGIKRQSLMSILSRKGVRRNGRRYVLAGANSSSRNHPEAALAPGQL